MIMYLRPPTTPLCSTKARSRNNTTPISHQPHTRLQIEYSTPNHYKMCEEIQFRYRLCHCSWKPTPFPCRAETKINTRCKRYQFAIRNNSSGNGYCAKHSAEHFARAEEDEWFEGYILRVFWSATILVGSGT
jgi:hypothetical protein